MNKTISAAKKGKYLAGADLASYETQAMNLCLVSVNGSAVPDAAYIQQQLNYG
jgi:hypothetical protein